MDTTLRPRRDFAALKARRLKAAQMFEQGHSQAEVVRRWGVSRPTAHRWYRAWRRQGRDGLRGAGRAGRRPRLSAEGRLRLVAALLEGPTAWGFRTDLWTLKRVGQVIAKTCHVSYSVPQVWRVLGQLGWSRQRPDRRARERNERAIRRWVRGPWPRVKKTLKN